MGLFGGSAPGGSGWDKIALLGAALKDASSGGSDNLANVQQMLAARQQQAQKGAFLQQLPGLIGGQASQAATDANAAPGAAVGGGLSNPNLPIAAILAKSMYGIDLSPAIDIMKANQPHMVATPDGRFVNDKDSSVADRVFANRSNVNGTIVDLNDPKNTNRAISEAPVKGAMPVYDNLGRVVDWTLPAGSQRSIGQAAEATQAGQTRGTMLSVPRSDGSHKLMLGSAYLGGGSGGPNATDPELGVSQTPAQAAAATARAAAGATADVNMPQTLSTANQALGLIDAIKTHPALRDRTGLRAVLPAIPGTPGADFDAMAAQLKGKVFLEAYGQLKGAGQITEVEGKKATEAVARLNQTQSHEGYMSALNDLASVIRSGAQRAQSQAVRLQPGGGQAQGSPAQPSRDAVAAEMRRRGLLR